jgi:hypothetical protein
VTVPAAYLAVAALALAPLPVLRYRPSLTTAELAAAADRDSIELSDGRRLSLGEIRRLRGALRRGPTVRTPAPSTLALPAPGRGIPVGDARSLGESLGRADSEAVVLPSGRRTTVGALRVLQAEVERRLGRSLLAVPARPSLVGPAIRVDAGSDWTAILALEDATILESPGSTRITVGELKQRLAGEASGRAAVRSTTR